MISFIGCLAVTEVSSPWAFFGTPFRAWELTLGAIVACLATLRVRIPVAVSAAGGWLGLAAIVTAAVLFTTDTPYPGIPTLLPVLGAANRLPLWATVCLAAAAITLHSGRSTASVPLALDPVATSFIPENLQPSLAAATADTGEIDQNGCQQNIVTAAVIICEYGAADADFTIALFGDSHAGRLFSALDVIATERGVRLVTLAKSRCQSEESDALWTRTDEPSCAAWRADAVAELAANPPDLIVVTNHIAPMPGRDQQILEGRWRDVTAQSIARLPPASAVVIIADTPQFAASPVDCLSGQSRLRRELRDPPRRRSEHRGRFCTEGRGSGCGGWLRRSRRLPVRPDIVPRHHRRHPRLLRRPPPPREYQ